MAKRFGRPSAQYRYEHYDPRLRLATADLMGLATPGLMGLAIGGFGGGPVPPTSRDLGTPHRETHCRRHGRAWHRCHRLSQRSFGVVLSQPVAAGSCSALLLRRTGGGAQHLHGL